MTSTDHDTAMRRKHFDKILQALRSELRNRYGKPGSSLFGADPGLLHDRLDTVAESCFQAALAEVGAHTPHKVFKRYAYQFLKQAVAPEIRKLDAAEPKPDGWDAMNHDVPAVRDPGDIEMRGRGLNQAIVQCAVCGSRTTA